MLVLICLLVPGPDPSAPPSPASGRPPTELSAAVAAPSTLVVEPAVEPVIADNFNPFDTDTPLEAMGATAFVYEPLLEYNELQVDQYYPWLAQSWSFSTSGLTITFTLRPGVRWDDGSPLTATDVAYTFTLLKDNPALSQGLPIVSAVATDASTFTLTLSKPGYTYLYEIARVPIVKAGFALGHNPATFVVKDPDGTGPYELARPGDINRHEAVLTARPGYWQQGEPPIGRLVFPAYKSTDAVQAALVAGKLDWAGNLVPDVQSTFTKKDPAFNHFWAPAVRCIGLQLNLGRYPLDQLAVRRAVSAAIGRQALSSSVAGGYDPPATNASALVTPLDNQYLAGTRQDTLDEQPDLGLVSSIMKAAGYVKDKQGFWAAHNGKQLTFEISALAGTVYASTAAVLAHQLVSAGFVVVATPMTSKAWAAALSTGDFDSAVEPGATGPSPYYMYDDWLSSPAVRTGTAGRPQAAQPVPATISTALAGYQDNPSDSARAVAAIHTLAVYVATQLPVVALMYGVAWAEYSTRHASGWPNGSDPYEPATPAAPFDEYTVLQLTPVTS